MGVRKNRKKTSKKLKLHSKRANISAKIQHNIHVLYLKEIKLVLKMVWSFKDKNNAVYLP